LFTPGLKTGIDLMKFFLLIFSILSLPGGMLLAGIGSEQASTLPADTFAAPQDKPYPGGIRLSVDATDINRRILRVHETIPTRGGNIVLYYPKWIPGDHGPDGPLDRFAGLVIRDRGVPVEWIRDSEDMYAFHVALPNDETTLDIDFQYLSPTSAALGAVEISLDILTLQWNTVALYPAGYYVRQIPVDASVSLPAGWGFGTALESASTDGATTSFRRVSLETLVDSPLYAGRNFARFDLDPGGVVPVHLNVFADRPALLDVSTEELKAHRALIQQAGKVFGPPHYNHYDFLLTVSDQIPFPNGLEHHQSSEINTYSDYFTAWDKTPYARDLVSHEYTHSWNGKFRRPDDLWTPNYNIPMRDTLLWVYEGQTEYWGQVLAARSGLWTKQQALDELARLAAYSAVVSGRNWRSLQDTVNDEIINPRHSQSWITWQRSEDYYDDGQLIWLEADTLIRDLSQNQRSLDDFARAFFDINGGSLTPITYTFQDVISTLNNIQQYDWNTFLHARLSEVGKPAPLDGIRRGGYKLIYTEEQGDYQRETEAKRGYTDFTFSIGVRVDNAGMITNVRWDGPGFNAGLAEGVQIISVNGIGYDAEVLKEAIKSAKDTTTPIELIIKSGNHFNIVRVGYHDGLRYPHLERDASEAARLDDILAAKR
jgi:predicted metalloprotease with PDZ domain